MHDYLITPTALTTTINLLKILPQECLNFECGISHNGEINFFWDNGGKLFQVHIGEDGELSYYGVVSGVEVGGSDINVSNFPVEKLLEFIQYIET